jgi:hypothetical protein
VDDQILEMGSLQPTFLIQADFSKSPGSVEVKCKVDNQPEGPCTSQQTSGCPVSQCWTETPVFTADGEDHQLGVILRDSSGQDTDYSEGLFFAVDGTPPDTKLVNFDGLAAVPYDFPNPTRVRFGFQAIDLDVDRFPPTFNCSITSIDAQAPGPWSPCTDGSTRPEKLNRKGRYRFWVRAVDYLGRPDPTPASYPFSPTPCSVRLLSHPRTLKAIVKSGVKLELTCVQPTLYRTAIVLNNKQSSALRLYPELGALEGKTTESDQTAVVTVHTYKKLPKVLFRQGHLFVGMVTNVKPGSPPGVVELKLKR